MCHTILWRACVFSLDHPFILLQIVYDGLGLGSGHTILKLGFGWIEDSEFYWQCFFQWDISLGILCRLQKNDIMCPISLFLCISLYHPCIVVHSRLYVPQTKAKLQWVILERWNQTGTNTLWKQLLVPPDCLLHTLLLPIRIRSFGPCAKIEQNFSSSCPFSRSSGPRPKSFMGPIRPMLF